MSGSITASSSVYRIPVAVDSLTFEGRQSLQLQEIEQRMEEQWKRKELEWRQTVEKMREEFLQLYPCDQSGLFDLDVEDEDKVIRRTGGGDVLDIKKFKTVFIETHPLSYSNGRSSDEEEDDDEEGGQGEGQGQGQNETRDGRVVIINGCGEESQQQPQRKLHLRFDVSGFDPKTIRVSVDSARITVQARRGETVAPLGEGGGGGVGTVEHQLFERKIQKPRQVDQTRIKAYLSTDGILVVEAPLTLRNHRNVRGRMTHSVSHTSRRSRVSRSSHGSRSPSSGSPGTPSTRGEKTGVPLFKKDDKGVKRLHLVVELGSPFTPDDVIVQVLKENKIQVMAKHKVQTDDCLNKTKFLKEYDLSEAIETYSLQGGLTPEGRLIVKALAKGQSEEKT